MKKWMIALSAMAAMGAAWIAHAAGPNAAGPNAYIGEFKDNTVTVLDTASNKVTASIPVPAGPHGLVISPDGRRVYLSSDGATTVSIIDTASNKVIHTVEVGKAPHGLALTRDGKRLLVAVFGTGQVVAIDTGTDSVVGQVAVPNPHNIAIRPDQAVAYVASQTPGSPALAWIDVERMNLINTVPLGKVPRALNFSPDGESLYFTQAGVDAVQILDAKSNRITGQIPVGASPHHVIFTPDGKLALVVSQGPGTLVGIDPARKSVLYSIPVGKQPHWIALTPDARTAYVTNEGDNTVSVVDLGKRAVTATIEVGKGPRKIDIQPKATQKTASVAQPMRVAAANAATVEIKDFAFVPTEIRVAAGQPVVWTNRDTVTHTVTGAENAWNSGDLSPGSRFSRTFQQPGTYEFACSIHPYMQGRVVVQ
jgi:YVTN family beta-propeller protein